jgi:hypothetical protein
MHKCFEMTPAVKKAQRALFAKLLNKYGNLRQVCLAAETTYQGLWNTKHLNRAVSYYLVVELCVMADGEVLPHELRPDIFKPGLMQLYRS